MNPTETPVPPRNPPRWVAMVLFLAMALATLVLGLRESYEASHEAPPVHLID